MLEFLCYFVATMTKDISLKVVRYENRYKNDWDKFVNEAKNSTFLFRRDFMEYHKDRFEDFSLMIFKDDKLVAVFPANISENKVYSHQGLTFGGLIVKNSSKESYQKYFYCIKKYLATQKIADLFVKQMSKPYQKEVSECDKNIEKKVVKEELNMQVKLDDFEISKSKMKHYKRNLKNDFLLVENDGLETFWNRILIPLLSEKYDAKPVHSLKEIEYLKAKFPDNITQYSLYYQNEIIAGITVFLNSENIVKSQYGAASSLGKKLRAIDFLFIELINKFKELNFTYFDMGTATDTTFSGGINTGLMNQKKELGCRAYEQNIIQISL